jgi:hypothetical protein
MLQLFHLSIAKVDLDVVVRKPKPSVVQLLQLPVVAKMQAVDMRVAGTGCHDRSAGCGAGWARTQCIGQDGTRASMLRASDAGARSSIWTDVASGEGMGAGHALDTGLDVHRDVWALDGTLTNNEFLLIGHLRANTLI